MVRLVGVDKKWKVIKATDPNLRNHPNTEAQLQRTTQTQQEDKQIQTTREQRTFAPRDINTEKINQSRSG